FESLTKTDPANPYGLYFCGLALSEDRKEAQAVETFAHLQRVLQRQAEPDKWKAMLREARLNEAITRLKLYRLDEGNHAIKILKDLIAELKLELGLEVPAGQTNTKAEESSVNEALEMATERGVYTTKLLTM